VQAAADKAVCYRSESQPIGREEAADRQGCLKREGNKEAARADGTEPERLLDAPPDDPLLPPAFRIQRVAKPRSRMLETAPRLL